MRNASDFRPKQGLSTVKVKPKIPGVVSDEAAELVNDLFDHLKACKPAWRQSFPDDKALNVAKREWTKAFIENGITSRFMISKGKSMARRTATPFFPSSGEFVSWCRPSAEDVGLPDARDAYKEACNAGQGHVWSHDAVHLAANATGRFELRRTPEGVMFPRFKKNYEVFCLQVMRGEKLVIGLPKPPPKPVFGEAGKPVRPDEVVSFLKNMRKVL